MISGYYIFVVICGFLSMIFDANNIPGRIINAIKGEKADWNQINHSKSFQIIPNHSKSTDNQSNLGNQKFSFFPLECNKLLL
jgi:hypothetical protein